MEKVNKKLIYEILLSNESFYKELEQIGSDNNYSRYHDQNADWYRSFGDELNKIINYNGQSNDELISYISTLQLTNEQKRSINDIRRIPMFKRLTGETALLKKSELENILGVKITSEGGSFAKENGIVVSVKEVKQLENELDSYSNELDNLFNSKSITREQYDNYTEALDYIYTYYISKSKGEQIPFRKISDSDYESIESKADENGITLSEQLSQINEDIKYDFDEVQELQSKGSHR